MLRLFGHVLASGVLPHVSAYGQRACVCVCDYADCEPMYCVLHSKHLAGSAAKTSASDVATFCPFPHGSMPSAQSLSRHNSALLKFHLRPSHSKYA